MNHASRFWGFTDADDLNPIGELLNTICLVVFALSLAGLATCVAVFAYGATRFAFRIVGA